MNNSGDITNSAIFLNLGGRGFARRFADVESDYYTKVEEAIKKTAENRKKQKDDFVNKFLIDNKKISDANLIEEEKKRKERIKLDTDYLKPLIDARKNTYEQTKKMKYDLTLLENKYHDYIIKNIDNLPKKIAALKKAFEYIRNTKLASKELSLKKKEFYKKQMNNYLKKFNKIYEDGSVKLQSLRTLYKLNLDLSLKKENEDRINEKLKTLQEQLIDLQMKLETAKINNNQNDIDEYTVRIDNIEKIFDTIVPKEKQVAIYINKVDTFYERLKKYSSSSIDYLFNFDV